MIASYLGMGMVKISQGDLTIAINPISKDFDSKAPKFGADITLSCLKDPAYNGIDNTYFGTKEPFVIDGPGEYEIGGIFVKGLPSEGAEGKINTIFSISIEGMNVCHLGALANPTLAPDTAEELGAIDLLFVPVGGKTLSPKDALKLASSLEAKMIIPLGNDREADTLKTFLKESGSEGKELDKLTIKKKDLEGKEGEILVLSSN